MERPENEPQAQRRGAAKRPVGRPFAPGQSGNPRGRPRRSAEASSSAIDLVVERIIPTRVGEEGRELTAKEAVRLRVFNEALSGKARAMRQVAGWLLKWEERPKKLEAPKSAPVEVKVEHWAENANDALVILGIAREDPPREERDPYRRLALREWAVREALTRRRGRAALTDEDWAEVCRCTEEGADLRRPRRRARGQR